MAEDARELLRRRMAEVLSLAPDQGAVEYRERWTSWGALAAAARDIEALLLDAGIPRAAPVGWVARNRPASVAAFVSLFLYGRPIAPLRPNQSGHILQEEVRSQKLKAILADAEDWLLEDLRVPAGKTGSLGIRIAGTAQFEVSLVDGVGVVGRQPHRADAPNLVVERLSSGTTGLPKRIAVETGALVEALRSAEAAAGAKAEPLSVKTSPAIILSPFTHSGGIFALMFALYQARPIVLFEKFDVVAWLSAVRRHQPKSASMVPAMLRMVLASDAPSDALKSLSAIRCGTAPLEAETQLAFEKRFGVPVLVDYGATEFIGGVAGWSLSDHRRFAEQKRGSVGRPRPDVAIRIVEPQSGNALPARDIGLLELKCDRFAPDWIRTTDLASLDEDGFLYIHGRADDAINRGGFKVLPDEVVTVLRQFPGVSDAAVIGAPDARLGEVPVAILETESEIAAAEIEAFARARLAPYQIPVEFLSVKALPRTTTMKVSRPEVRALYQRTKSS